MCHNYSIIRIKKGLLRSIEDHEARLAAVETHRSSEYEVAAEAAAAARKEALEEKRRWRSSRR